ncbi:MAG: STAS domain-containing protein [Alphaproteobacteria bacterium]|nr:STAS domain-containing protein [Alphaproteobacteria bacterium]
MATRELYADIIETRGHISRMTAVDLVQEGDAMVLRPPATLDLPAAAALWRPMLGAVAERRVTIDASGVTKLDSAGAVLLLEAAGGSELRPPQDAKAAATLERMRLALAAAPPPKPARPQGELSGRGHARHAGHARPPLADAPGGGAAPSG